jgi:pSer/pThr/pTyr-binding forkhead associated (FHA) protein
VTSPTIIQLRVVQGRPAGKCLKFPRGDFYFGRGAECQVRPNSDWVSRQHCRLRVRPDVVSIRDLGSTNGTLVNGELIHEERRLRHGDQIEIGPLVFEVLIEGATPLAVCTKPATIRPGAPAEVSPPANEGAPHEGGPSLGTTEHHPIVPKDS